jgi:signal peptidase II
MQGTGADRRKRLILEMASVILLILLITLDQLTKAYFKRVIPQNGDIDVIKNFFYFTYTVNTGAAWSFLAGVSWAQTFFKILTAVALILFVFFYLYAGKKGYQWLRFALILVIGGTVGNFIDRLLINGVTDFIGFQFGSYFFPIFNLADSFLCVGVIMMVVHFLFLDENAVFKKKDGNEEKTNG